MLLLGELEEGGRVSRPDRVRLAAPLEELEGVLADRLQHRVARFVIAAAVTDEALVEEGREPVEDLELAVRGADPFSHFERPAAGEDGEPAEEHTLILSEKVIAPVDSGAQGALPVITVACPARQELEALLEPSEQGRRREELDANGRELDRKWKMVEAAADLEDSRPVAVEREAREDGARSFREELQCLGLLERRDLILVLGGEMQRRPARREHSKARRCREQLRRDRSGRLEVLKVVEQQQELLLAQVSL